MFLLMQEDEAVHEPEPGAEPGPRHRAQQQAAGDTRYPYNNITWRGEALSYSLKLDPYANLF